MSDAILQPCRRPKSAPVFNSDSSTVARPRSRLRSTDGNDKNWHTDEAESLSFEDTINRFHTTGRMLQRLKERRRTEAEITVCLKPSELLEAEMPTRRISHGQLDNLLSRVCRPTAAHKARVSSCRRINAKDIYVPPKVLPVRVEYYHLDTDRFKGTRPMSSKARDDLINRLSAYNPMRGPAESKGTYTKDLSKQLGPLASYRWRGIKNS